MAESHSRIHLALLVAVLIGVATVSMVVDRRALRDGTRDLPGWAGPILDLTIPVQRAVAFPAQVMRGAWSHYVSLVGVHEKNEVLGLEVARLREENLQLREALVAGGRLERIAEMREDFEMPMLPTELVGSDVSPFFHSVLLDRGRSDGVRSGMPVINESGLVGLVVATSSHASKTMLLLDRQIAIDGTVQRSRARGIVRGRGDDAPLFEFVARGGDVEPGDLLITSGLDGVYPKGLLIGTVSELEPPGARLLRTAQIEPAVDFGRLEQAFVMLRRGPTMELLYATGPSGDRVAQAAEGAP
jgi:rod shape-determining protein MreC